MYCFLQLVSHNAFSGSHYLQVWFNCSRIFHYVNKGLFISLLRSCSPPPLPPPPFPPPLPPPPPSTSMLLLRQMNILTNILTRVSLMHMLEILYNSSLQVKLLGSRSCPPKIFLSSNLLVPVTLPATAHKMVHSGFCFYWLLLLFFIVSISLFNAPFIILFVLPFGAHFFYST